jgi:pyruvate dehydrogenase E2 component (dihydrolipoamide acetyltransferase)
MNSSMKEEGILYHPQINIGIAVDTDSGLVVPVLKDVPNRKLLDLLKDFQNLVEKARSGRAGKNDISGGTFTITNLGMYRVDTFTPIINLPECAILGLGRIRKQPVERNGEIVLGQIMTLSLSFDHRLVDGSPAARFLDRICELIEKPALALTGLALD